MDKRCRPNGKIAADGFVSDVSQDAPIQQSVYIFPGDEHNESYRLWTFKQHPITCLIKRRKFAKSGFFFTGFADQVKCFACKTKVQEWNQDDDPADQKWHKEECPFILGQECGNIPLPCIQFSSRRSTTSQSNTNENPDSQQEHDNKQQKKRHERNVDDSAKRMKLAGGTSQRSADIPFAPPSEDPLGSPNRDGSRTGVELLTANMNSNKAVYLTNLNYSIELDRLASFAEWPVQKPSVTPADLAKNGFFYLGNSDRTQCFSCSEVLNNWSPDDDVAVKHARHSPDCKMSNGSEIRNVPVNHVPETPEQREENYPCRSAGNPNMRAVRSRLETFDHRWPENRTNATPEQLAEAGYFYLGEDDKVKCWYCDGILRDWERDDDPWEEHAKWFPTCQFLLRNKGLQFVYRHLASNAHLPRPTISRHGRPSSVPPERSTNARILPTITANPQEEERLRQERVHFVMENSDIIKVVLQMGFAKEIVEMQLMNFMLSAEHNIPDGIYDSAAQLVVDILQNEEELERQVEENNQTGEDLILSAKEEGWREAMQKLADERLCKVCLLYPHDSVFIPCGHLCCCLVCALCLKKCPICRKKIEICVPTYEP